MRKIKSSVVLILIGMLMISCGKKEQDKENSKTFKDGVELEVVTTFAGGDSNVQNFKNYYRQWENETNNKVVDLSAVSDDAFKIKVQTDFETASEPDVLFFFTGADANAFIEAGKVVSIEEIREQYPEYAQNMDDSRIPVSLVDEKAYAVPVNGFWEALFVNTEILQEAGVAMPGSNYTWEQFLNDCEAVKEAGYIPIAAALGHIPHYWWEYTIFNHTSPETHLNVPVRAGDEQGVAWLEGMRDIKALYTAGYFPENTLSATDDETFALFTEGRAAFLLDGAWKVGSITDACQTDPDDRATLVEEKLNKFDITFVPAQGNRKASDMIGGMSMGYYITKQAWNDPEKREVAVRFVEYMTSDEVVHAFAQHTATALKNEPEEDDTGYTSLQKKAMGMISRTTSFTRAVQDSFQGECRTPIFDGLPEIVTGNAGASEAIQEGLDIYWSR